MPPAVEIIIKKQNKTAYLSGLRFRNLAQGGLPELKAFLGHTFQGRRPFSPDVRLQGDTTASPPAPGSRAASYSWPL